MRRIVSVQKNTTHFTVTYKSTCAVSSYNKELFSADKAWCIHRRLYRLRVTGQNRAFSGDVFLSFRPRQALRNKLAWRQAARAFPRVIGTAWCATTRWSCARWPGCGVQSPVPPPNRLDALGRSSVAAWYSPRKQKTCSQLDWEMASTASHRVQLAAGQLGSAVRRRVVHYNCDRLVSQGHTRFGENTFGLVLACICLNNLTINLM